MVREGGEAGPGRGRRRSAPATSTVPARLDGGWKGGAENRNARPSRDIPSRHTLEGAVVSRERDASAVGATSVKATAHFAKDEKLHPSWEAKRKMKEREQVAILPGVQGKKIKF
jgi:hypothetical protein